MLKEEEKHLVKFCQCTFAKYLERMSQKDDEDDNNELSSDTTSNQSTLKEEES